MIAESGGVFRLDTPGTTYLFQVTESGHLLHLYYGPRLSEIGDTSAYACVNELRMPTIVNYSEETPRQYMTLLPLETSAPGKGDLRGSAFAGEWGESGQTVFDFKYLRHTISDGEARGKKLPWPQARKTGAMTLQVTLEDQVSGLLLHLYYTVYPDSDVIVRRTAIENATLWDLTVRTMYSLQLDWPGEEWEVLTLPGGWARERQMARTRLSSGTFIFTSRAGISSAECNPLLVVKSRQGCVMTNLLYSGDHRESAEVSYGQLRILTGISPESFSWRVQTRERFDSPEAVMVYAREENALSQAMHDFAVRYICPPSWAQRERPVVLNSWEGMGLDITEEKILRQAAAGRDLGAELFVIDDGWFRHGLEAKGGLGDWRPVQEKFPGGLERICKELHDLGLMAGIWVEPEMISKDSDLYRIHPEYLVRCPRRTPSPGRDQYVLDLTRKEVQNYLVKALARVIDAGFDYVKWDMNRYLADDYTSSYSVPEFRTRWIMGSYEVHRRIRKRYPQLLLEGCASGGSRFDLGMLAYCDQIWGSDNTDPSDRAEILYGTSFGYPQRTFGAHLARNPSGITRRMADPDMPFSVNAFGAFGLELDVEKLSPEEADRIRRQIAFYKQYRKCFQQGRFVRIENGRRMAWAAEGEDGTILSLLLIRRQNLSRKYVELLRVPCREDILYRVTLVQGAGSGWTRTVPGALLSSRGMVLPSVFTGTETNDTVLMGDDCTCLFVLEPLERKDEISG